MGWGRGGGGRRGLRVGVEGRGLEGYRRFGAERLSTSAQIPGCGFRVSGFGFRVQKELRGFVREELIMWGPESVYM